ncbi:MAG: hypothetical protein FJX42_08995 [Alphaproteobacteria bacterium]|nr:hypothetical protein [Alphaproteobacteria bacterium]
MASSERSSSRPIAVLAGALVALAACAPAMEVATSFPNPIAVALSPFEAPRDPTHLVGHSGREVAGWLGEPVLKRRDPPAELWQYRAEGCTVDFFLYGPGGRKDDMENALLSVSHVEIRPRGADRASCMKVIRAARNAPSASSSPAR